MGKARKFRFRLGPDQFDGLVAPGRALRRDEGERKTPQRMFQATRSPGVVPGADLGIASHWIMRSQKAQTFAAGANIAEPPRAPSETSLLSPGAAGSLQRLNAAHPR